MSDKTVRAQPLQPIVATLYIKDGDAYSVEIPSERPAQPYSLQ